MRIRITWPGTIVALLIWWLVTVWFSGVLWILTVYCPIPLLTIMGWLICVPLWLFVTVAAWETLHEHL